MQIDQQQCVFCDQHSFLKLQLIVLCNLYTPAVTALLSSKVMLRSIVLAFLCYSIAMLHCLLIFYMHYLRAFTLQALFLRQLILHYIHLTVNCSNGLPCMDPILVHAVIIPDWYPLVHQLLIRPCSFILFSPTISLSYHFLYG